MVVLQEVDNDGEKRVLTHQKRLELARDRRAHVLQVSAVVHNTSKNFASEFPVCRTALQSPSWLRAEGAPREKSDVFWRLAPWTAERICSMPP
jgi:hypothetical protein